MSQNADAENNESVTGCFTANTHERDLSLGWGMDDDRMRMTSPFLNQSDEDHLES